MSGQLTVWMALCFLVFLGLYLACMDSVWKQYRRQEAMQAAEAGFFSLFSEFEPHLLEKYDLFFLDTSFRSGTESQERLCSHLWQHTRQNLRASKLQGVQIKNPVRATDGQGAVFYRQAVEIMKEKTGASLAEDWLLVNKAQSGMDENTKRFQEDRGNYENVVRNYEEEDEEEEDEGDGEADKIAAEAYEWDGLIGGYTWSMAIPSDLDVSSKAINIENVPSRRALSEGFGTNKGDEGSILNRQWFISYLCEYMEHAQEAGTESEGGFLDYQLEYILNGKSSDRENLSATVDKIMLLREGTNYVFLLQHPSYESKAKTLSLILVGLTGNGALIEAVKHLILLGWAYGESLVETRQLLNGCEVAAVKTEADWQVPLSGLLSLIVNPGRYDMQGKKEGGMSYETCLKLFLNLVSTEDLAMRGLDIIEGELQAVTGCEKIHLDHCVESFTAQLWFDDIYLERTYRYE